MKPIRVYCNYKVIDGPWGGANSFLRSLMRCFKTMPEIEVVSSERDGYDIFFLNQLSRGPGRSWWEPQFISPVEIKRVKQYGVRSWLQATLNRLAVRDNSVQHKKVVCRLVNLKEHAYGFKASSDRELLAALQCTDFDVFQSDYIRGIFLQFGYKKSQSTVIYNGVDQGVFNLSDKLWWDGQSPLRVYSCTFATRQSKRFDIIAQISEQKGIECYHIGSWPDNVDLKKVKLLGKIPQREFAEMYRRHAHVFLHPAEKDICPNGVIEALSSGLPVLFGPLGGTQEVVGACGVALGSDLASAMEKMRSDYPEYVERIKSAWHTYSIEFAAEQYKSVFQQVIKA